MPEVFHSLWLLFVVVVVGRANDLRVETRWNSTRGNTTTSDARHGIHPVPKGRSRLSEIARSAGGEVGVLGEDYISLRSHLWRSLHAFRC